MSPSKLLLLALCTLVAVARAHDTDEVFEDECDHAYADCIFRFETSEPSTHAPVFSVAGPPDVPFTSRIVSAGSQDIGILNTNDVPVEVVNEDGSATPVTEFGNPPFSPTHIKPVWIEGTAGSGLAHQSFSGNQRGIATAGACVRIFFTSYQVFRRGGVVRNVNLSPEMARRRSACVVFRSF